MADVPTFDPNPYANFDPSQFSNPYSLFNKQALPWPSSYAGWPTDWQGKPIQQPPGMTLNSSPATPQSAPQLSQYPQGIYTPGAAQQLMGAQYGQKGGSMPLSQFSGGVVPQSSGGGGVGMPGAIGNAQNSADASGLMMLLGMDPSMGMPQQAKPQQQAAPQANSSGLTPEQYMALRANPGRVTTPGATVPQAAPAGQQGSGVLQSFLQNWKPAQSGPNATAQQGFAKTLKGMGY